MNEVLTSDAVIWHEVECAAYEDDLPLWQELAARHGGPVLDLGSGSGRVALDLARRGSDVWALDLDRELAAALSARAANQKLDVTVEVGDCRALSLGRRFPLVLAPMQLLQLLGGREGRAELLTRVASHLERDGVFAAAIVEGLPASAEPSDGHPALPDLRDVDGRVHSSLPLGTSVVDGHLEIRRLRQVVAIDGVLSEETHFERLDLLDAATLEAEASGCGLRPLGRSEIDEGPAHIGSMVVLLGKDG